MIRKGAMIYNGLKGFMECERKSCSFDPELIKPLMVHCS